ncbi:hypothetical protein BDV96DRAFT_592158 [Lophiotrema nucula]|uniref:Uncharacterized protein n=1 Tax=Lophiotrema nucula TaxID=690887 RepID=A0A6A5YEV5_9PLEO|nr:hypothetical protein BDV96DRAFT_592158 [Lophiotrema nucula]
MRPKARSTRNQMPIRLDPQDSAAGYNADPTPPNSTQDYYLEGVLLHKAEPVELSHTLQDHFVVSPGAQQQTHIQTQIQTPASRRRSSSNLARLSANDARSQLPAVKYNDAPVPPINPALRRYVAPSALPSPSPFPLQQQNPNIQSPTTTNIFPSRAPPPLGFFNAPPPPNRNGHSDGELHRRASLMGVTDLDLSGEKYKGIDHDPDPFDMPGQHWATKGMTPGFAMKQLEVRKGFMNGSTATVNDNDKGYTGEDWKKKMTAAMAAAPRPNRGVAGLTPAFVNFKDGYCSGSLIDMGESEGWAGRRGVPPRLRQPISEPINIDSGKQNDNTIENDVATTADRATALQGRVLTLTGTLPPAPISATTPLFQPQDRNKPAPEVDMDVVLSYTHIPVSLTHLDTDTQKHWLSRCTQDADGGYRAPEPGYTESRMAVEYGMRARRYWVKEESGETWVKDVDGTSGVVEEWRWDV